MPSSVRVEAAVTFTESSFFPIPPDIMLIPMVLAVPKNALKIAEAVKENNAEDSSPYVIYAYSERMKGNYDKAIKYTDEGIVLS